MPASGSDDNMRSELETLQMQANAKTDESLDSTRRMLQMCEESQDVGIKTIVMLDQQGEQLDRIEEGMEKCCGLCVLPWKRMKNFEKGGAYDKTWKASEDGKVNTDGPRVMVDERNGAGPQGGFITKITNDAREEEMENNLTEVSGMLGNLRNMAIDMGSEITSQNNQLDRISNKATSLNDRVDVANTRAKKILRDN
ncbi:SNAP25 [Mytilus edulis]|uniref:Synaptosomal-associated protein n=1 Tax=Mytilus edulis TaxID=6550 RepID=A0A8S3VII9_MYTED|nr:SNAP25 [Mytilus edulis]